MKNLIFIIGIALTFTACEVCETCTTTTIWDYPYPTKDITTKSTYDMCGKKDIKNAEGRTRTETVVNGVKVVVYAETICLSK